MASSDETLKVKFQFLINSIQMKILNLNVYVASYYKQVWQKYVLLKILFSSVKKTHL